MLHSNLLATACKDRQGHNGTQFQHLLNDLPPQTFEGLNLERTSQLLKKSLSNKETFVCFIAILWAYRESVSRKYGHDVPMNAPEMPLFCVINELIGILS